MKITIIGPAYPYRGGIALFSNRLAEEFVAKGHDVQIVTFTRQYPSFLFPGKTQFVENEPKPDLNIVRAIDSINPFNWKKVGKSIQNAQPDLVIFAYWMPFMAPCFSSIAKQMKKNGHTKTIGLVHNLIPHERHTADQKLSAKFIRQMDAFMTLSDSVRDDILRIDNTKTVLTSPHPLYDNFGKALPKEQAIKQLNLDPNYHYLLFFGIIRKYKGLDWLLEAFADDRIDRTKIKLIVAGEFYEDEKPYHEIIEQHHLEDSIVWANHFIPDAEVVNYFCAADMVVQPYKHATQSGVTQIAYHFERPMLVTDVGGLREIVPNQKVGYVVEPNVSAVSDALVDFYQNKREETFVEGVKEEKMRYTWDKMVDGLIGLYQSL